MDHGNHTQPLATVLADPKSAFGHPDEVVHNAQYSPDDKLAILKQWRQDALALQRAESEAMEGGEDSLLQTVDQAISKLRAAQS